MDSDGFSTGPWTAELLTDAISSLDGNFDGIELRTVQFWFQDNEKGISSDNIRWLARVFGCDDPEKTRIWQVQITTSLTILVTKRREKASKKTDQPSSARNMPEVNARKGNQATSKRFGFKLAQRSEALFDQRSSLNLPAAIFAGAAVLAFVSYFFNIHDVSFGAKQVGFLWAPNWTLLFMGAMPLYVTLVRHLLIFWKRGGRASLSLNNDSHGVPKAWLQRIEDSSFSFWVVFLVCLLVAGLLQWVGTRLLPLLEGDLGNFTMDWGAIAIARPEVVTVSEAAIFTGMAYLYMAACFYIFFAGLILIFSVALDLRALCESAQGNDTVGSNMVRTGMTVMTGIFRCTLVGLLVAISMRLQSAYLRSDGDTILSWLGGDLSYALFGREELSEQVIYNTPAHFSSFLVLGAAAFVFLFCFLCVLSLISVASTLNSEQSTFEDGKIRARLWAMGAVSGLLIACYVLIDAFYGFSILLCVAVLMAICCLMYPRFGWGVLKGVQ